MCFKRRIRDPHGRSLSGLLHPTIHTLAVFAVFAFVAACGDTSSPELPDATRTDYGLVGDGLAGDGLAGGDVLGGELGAPEMDGGGSSGDGRAGDARTGDARAGDARTGDARTGDARTGDARAGDARRGDARAGDARAGDARTGDARAGDARTGDASIETGCLAGCTNPPADRCASSTARMKYPRRGTCEVDACAYQEVQVDCSEGCFGGGCLPQSRTNEWIPSTAGTATNARIAVDAAGKIHIVACVDSDVVYHHETIEGWKTETVDPGMGRRCKAAIAVDTRGHAHFAYYDSSHSDVRYARWDGSAMKLELVETAGLVGEGVRIVIDSTEKPQVAYFRRLTTRAELVVARVGNTGKWKPQTIATVASGSDSIEFASRPDGRLHLVTGKKLRYFINQHEKWVEEALPSGAQQLNRSLNFSANGSVLLVFGTADGGHLRRYGFGPTRDEKLWESSVALKGLPRLAFDPHNDGRILLEDRSMLQRTALGFWMHQKKSPFSLAEQTTILDGILPSDGRARLLLRYAKKSLTVMTAPACKPMCGDKRCGSDGCGGDCGACPGSEVCGVLGRCTPWRLSRIEPSSNHFTKGKVFVVGGEIHAISSKEHLVLTSGAWKRITAPFDSAYRRSLFQDRKGTLHAAWITRLSGYVHLGTFRNGAWTDITKNVRAHLALALYVDDAGVYHLFFGRRRFSITYPMAHAQFTTIASDGKLEDLWVAEPSMIAVEQGAKGSFHVVASSTRPSIEYGTNASGKWVKETIDGSYKRSYPVDFRLLADSSGKLHLSYWDGVAKTPIYATKSGSTPWTRETLPGHTLPFLAVNSSGDPTIVGGNKLWRKLKGSWQEEGIPLIMPAPEFYSGPAIVYDSKDRLHLVYSVDGSLGRIHTMYGWR